MSTSHEVNFFKPDRPVEGTVYVKPVVINDENRAWVIDDIETIIGEEVWVDAGYYVENKYDAAVQIAKYIENGFQR